jgi:hypothetical protein
MAYVMMAIPAELVPAVTEFIENRREGVGADAGRDDVHGSGVGGWDPATIARAYRESANPMRKLLDFLSRHPDEEVSSYELAQAIEARYGWNTVAGMLGAFGRRSANRYGRSSPMWEVRHDEEGRVLLTMPRDAAMAVEEARMNL